MNIVQIILKLLGGGDIIGRIASMLGLNPDQATKAIGAAVPAILAGITGAASKPGGAEALASALTKHDSGLLDNIGGMLAGPDAAVKGSNMLSGLLGSEGLGQIGGVLSKFTGMGQDGSGKLLGLLAPVVIGAIGKQTQGMDASGIASLLSSQTDNIASALPSGLGSMLSSAVPGMGGLLGSASGAAANLAHGAGREVEKAGSSAMKWLIPAILGILAILLLPKMCSKATDATKEVTDKAGDAIAAATDGTKFVSDATDVLKTATESVASIKDEASAGAAVPKLRELAAKIGGLEGMLAKLPASVQSTVRTTLRPLIEKLREAAQPVLAMPVIGAQVKPALDELFRQLELLVPAQ